MAKNVEKFPVDIDGQRIWPGDEVLITCGVKFGKTGWVNGIEKVTVTSTTPKGFRYTSLRGGYDPLLIHSNLKSKVIKTI